MLENYASLYYFWPELVLTIGLGLVVLGDLVRRGISARTGCVLTLLTLAGVAVATGVTAGRHVGLFGGLLARDPFGDFFKYLFAAVTALVALAALRSRDAIDYTRGRGEAEAGEFYALLLAVTLGMNLMAGAADLLLLYLSLELVSLLSYVLAGYRRQGRRSSEAALKYAIYGGVASGAMLYGMSLLYGLAGSTSLAAVKAAAAGAPAALWVTAIALVMAGFGYKIASVPFHMWCPDVYEGAPTPVTAFLSVGPKAAGFALLCRFFFSVTPDLGAEGFAAGSFYPAFIGVMSMLTMTVGNLTAILQHNLKRLLAYSSIAHAGYLLMGLATGTSDGVQAIMLYLCVYLVMNLGAFLVVIVVADAGHGETIDDYRGLGYRAPFVAVMMGVFLFSLTGIPPLAGFVGKFYLFAAVLEKGGPFYVILAVVGVLNSAVSLYYYARVIRAMFLEAPRVGAPAVPVAPLHAYQLGALAALTLVIGIYWAPLVGLIGRSLAQWAPASAALSAALR